MKRTFALLLLAVAFTGCAQIQVGTMMSERPAAKQEAGMKMLVGKLEIRGVSTTEVWPGNIEVCTSPIGNPQKLTCDFVTFKRAECAVCTAQPNFKTDSGYIFMPMPAGYNELREIRLTNTTPVVGLPFYTFYQRGMGFQLDPATDVTNFGVLAFAMAKPVSSTSPDGMLLKLADVAPSDTTALKRYMSAVSATTVPTVSTVSRTIFVDKSAYRQQVRVSRLQMTHSTMPMYIPMRHH